MTEDDLELVAEFRTESLEHFEQVEPLFLEIEAADPDRRHEIVNAAFRAVHSVKGTAGFFDLSLIQNLSHASESLLMKLRDGELCYQPAMTDVLLAVLDKLRRLVEALPQVLALSIDEDLAALQASMASEPGSAPAEGAVAPASISPELREGDTPSSSVSRTHANETLRVSVRLLDKLMDSATELVLARNQLVNRLSDVEDESLRTVLQNIDLITSELQGGIMNTRMQPVGSLFKRFGRVVRDLSRDLGKQVELEVQGGDVDLDRSILEMLGDPMTHLVRNALDHGIETPAERAFAGKNETARLRLRAYHQQGLVHVEVSDDGRGIDIDKLRQAAVHKGIIEPERAHSMSEAQALQLIFAPGFSTAATVTGVSGGAWEWTW